MRNHGKRLRSAVLAYVGAGRIARDCVHRFASGHNLCEKGSLCCGRGVDFVRIDFLVEGFANSQI
jgi:hypothetical protein